MRRIVMLLSVVALMAVMVAISVAPAFAAWEANGCRTGSFLVTPENESQAAIDKNLNGTICFVVHGDRAHYYDDRPVA
jgi:hypothetical protein